MDRLLVYGAYGYTGSLIAEEAVARGGSPVLAGRNRERVRSLATDLGLEYRVFDLEGGIERIADHLEPFDAVCNCAGPFVDTAQPLVEAGLEAGTDYLDITGEFPVFDRLARLDERATGAGVTVLPGVGFDVVPTDSLAAALAERLPGATTLELAVTTAGSVSSGTAKTAITQMDEGSLRRRRGRLVQTTPGSIVRDIDFGPAFGVRPATPVSWGDLVTAPYSTGIDTVTVYLGLPRAGLWGLRLARPLQPLVTRGPVQSGLEWLIDRTVEGPDGQELVHGRAAVWGAVTDGGRTVTGRLSTPNVYALTVDTAVSAAQRTLADEPGAGFQTPATAFGPEFVLECTGVERDLFTEDGGVDG